MGSGYKEKLEKQKPKGTSSRSSFVRLSNIVEGRTESIAVGHKWDSPSVVAVVKREGRMSQVVEAKFGFQQIR